MTIDVFNNPSNDYVYPALSPCAGVSDSANLEFIKDGIGIISGSDILAKIDFSNLSIPVTAYSTETKVLGQGEVVYIPGLSKGLQKRQQGFLLPYLVSYNESLNPYFFSVDLSINYYKNFKFYNQAIDVTANYSQNINIVDALNIQFGNLGINITASLDSSALIFTGDVDGFDFTASNVILNIIDASIDSASPFPHEANLDSYTLEESEDYDILYAKYPNGAMQGIIMKSTYPNFTPESPYDKWLYIKHVNDYVKIYEPIEIRNYLNEIQIDFDPNIIFGPFIGDGPFVGDVTTGLYNIELEDTLIGPGDLVDDCSLINCNVLDSSITKSHIYWTDFANSIVENTILFATDLSTAEIIASLINDSSLSSYNFIDSSIVHSLIYWSDVSNCVIEKSDINIFQVDASERSFIGNSVINETTIWNSEISDSSIYNSIIYDVSLIRCTLYNCEKEITTLEDCKEIRINETASIVKTYLDSSTYYQKFIKKLDVGMNGSSTETIMSAGDYLDYITSNDLWRKFGDFYAWTTAPDGCPDCDNLIDGFYVYNPHTFNIKIEYMLFV